MYLFEIYTSVFYRTW